jgi:hypothetical protein
MFRHLLTGIAALGMTSSVALAQDYSTTTTLTRDDSGAVVRERSHTVVYPDPAKHAAKGALFGGGAGALIGCLVTIPIGCAPGAAVGAAIGGGGGAVAGAASTPPPHVVRNPPED